MSKELAIGLGAIGVAAVGFFTKRALQKRAINKALNDPKLKAKVNEAVVHTMSYAAHVFEKQFNDALPIEFNPAWANGTGYYDNAVNFHVPVGKVYKTTDTGTSRRLLLVGTEHGTAVFFERYTPGHGPMVIVSNVPRQLRDLVPNGSLLGDDLAKIIGTLTTSK
jgi:hypothetical protein